MTPALKNQIRGVEPGELAIRLAHMLIAAREGGRARRPPKSTEPAPTQSSRATAIVRAGIWIPAADPWPKHARFDR